MQELCYVYQHILRLALCLAQQVLNEYTYLSPLLIYESVCNYVCICVCCYGDISVYLQTLVLGFRALNLGGGHKISKRKWFCISYSSPNYIL